mgnify:CR=1 FL=1
MCRPIQVVIARDPEALTLVSRTFWGELRRWLREASDLKPGADARVEARAITFVQRFGGSLNLNVHSHVMVANGVWRCPTDGHSPRFVATPGADTRRPHTRGEARRAAARARLRAEANGARRG